MNTEPGQTDILQDLRQQLTDHMTVSQIKGVIFDMEYDPELLTWDNRTELAIEWIRHCNRRNTIDELQTKVNRLFHEMSQRRLENPFFAGGRINDPKQFFGRSQMLREVRNELRNMSSVSIVGESEIGKSTFLSHLYNTRTAWYPDAKFIYLDLQRMWDQKDFIEEVLKALGRKGNKPRDLKKALAENERNLVFLFDEMERLAKDDIDRRLHDLLRSHAQDSHIAMCFATHKPLIELFPPREPGGVSPFHNIFTVKPLDRFTAEDANRFLQERLDGLPVRFEPDEIESIVGQSEGHPGKLQKMAKGLFDKKLRGRHEI